MVWPVTLEEAIEITEAWAVLEGLCAAKAAAAETRADHRELKATGRQMTEAVRNGDVMGL